MHAGKGVPGKFFDTRLEQSRVKAEIIARYFSIWSAIIVRSSEKLAYVDLFCGPGRYEDGSPSTPIMILERAIADPKVRVALVSVFNDVDAESTTRLEAEIGRLPGVQGLKYKPKVYTDAVGAQITETFRNMNLVPTLAFIDPWGYKGLTRGLVRALIKDWASECAFFFNYNRISMGLTNTIVDKHMRAIFGDAWLESLRAEVLTAKSRERAILRALKNGLRELGAEHVMTYRFRGKTGRTSHYLIFVSKHALGCDRMRSVMASMSSHKDVDDVPSFEHDVRLDAAPELAVREGGKLQRLKSKIVTFASRQTMKVNELVERHSHGPCRPFTFANYQEALRQLETEGKITVTRPPRGRSTYRGKRTMQADATISVPATKG